MRSLLRRPEAPIFVAVLGAYAYFFQGGGANQNSRFDLVRALVERGTSEIDAYHPNTLDKSERGGHYYCDKAPGTSWLAVPVYAAAHAALAPGAAPPSESFLAGSLYAVTIWTIGLPSALSVVVLALLLGWLGVPLRARLGLATAYGLATLAFPYSTLFYGHQLAAALLIGAFALLVRGRSPSARSLAAVGFLLGAAVAVEYPAALAALVIALYAVFAVRPLTRLAWIAAGAAPAAVALALYHSLVFGGPFALPYDFSIQPNRSAGLYMGIGAPDLRALWHLTLSPYRGLFFSAPWLLLAIPGAVLLWRARRAEVVACAAIALLFLWMNSSLVDWEGGGAFGPRYLVPCLPFLCVLTGGVTLAADGRPRLRRALQLLGGAAAIYSAFLMLAATAVRPEVAQRERHPFGDVILPQLADGALAVNRRTVGTYARDPGDPADEPSLGAVVARGPGRAWNLGHRARLDGVASLVPLGLFWIGCALWLRRLLSRPAAGPGAARGPRPDPSPAG